MWVGVEWARREGVSHSKGGHHREPLQLDARARGGGLGRPGDSRQCLFQCRGARGGIPVETFTGLWLDLIVVGQAFRKHAQAHIEGRTIPPHAYVDRGRHGHGSVGNVPVVAGPIADIARLRGHYGRRWQMMRVVQRVLDIHVLLAIGPWPEQKALGSEYGKGEHTHLAPVDAKWSFAVATEKDAAVEATTGNTRILCQYADELPGTRSDGGVVTMRVGQQDRELALAGQFLEAGDIA